MAFVRATIALLILLCTSITVYADHHDGHHHHHHPKAPSPSPIYLPIDAPTASPTYPPVKPPVKPPISPPIYPPMSSPILSPVYPPVKPPGYPKRKMVFIRGLVYCKSCKYRGIDTFLGATPLAGAVVQLECRNTKKPLVQKIKTGKNGFFLFTSQKLSTFGVHKCTVTVTSVPKSCSEPAFYAKSHGKDNGGGMPIFTGAKPSDPFVLYTVKTLTFQPPKKYCRY